MSSQAGCARNPEDNRLISWTLDPKPDLRTVLLCRTFARSRHAVDDRAPEQRGTTKCLEAARAFTFTWIRSTDSLALDPAAEAVLGQPASVLKSGRAFLDLVDPADQERLTSRIAAATRGAPHFHADYRITPPKGTPVWIEETGRVVFSPNGRKSGIIGCAGT